MRLALFLVLGVFLWAGTVSIKFPVPQSIDTPTSEYTCSGQLAGEQLMDYLKMGRVTSIYDNGKILTIGLPSTWEDLSSNLQQQTYATVVCYAQSQQRPFQLLVSQEM